MQNSAWWGPITLFLLRKIPALLFLSALAPNLLALALVKSIVGINISWGTWFIAFLPSVFSMAESELILVLLSLIDMALFGGTALAWMDEVSFIAATRFCRLPLVTVSTDRIDFNHPIAAGCIVELVGRVVKVGNTSLKVEVEVYVESMSCDGRELAIQGLFSFVAIDDDKRPGVWPAGPECRCCLR